MIYRELEEAEAARKLAHRIADNVNVLPRKAAWAEAKKQVETAITSGRIRHRARSWLRKMTFGKS